MRIRGLLLPVSVLVRRALCEDGISHPETVDPENAYESELESDIYDQASLSDDPEYLLKAIAESDIRLHDPEIALYHSWQGYEVRDGIEPLLDHGSGAERDQCHLEKEMPALQEDKTLTVYFLRHAESTWNRFTSQHSKLTTHEGWINENVPQLTDAHLSGKGIHGALEVRRWLENGPCEDPQGADVDRCFLAGMTRDPKRKVVFATSNLRRAQFTTMVAFAKRMPGIVAGAVSKISSMHILSSMQEITSNIDSKPVTPNGEIPWLTFENEYCPFRLEDVRNFFVTQCDVQDENRAEVKRDTLMDFCWWARQQAVNGRPSVDPEELGTGITDLVLTGHSIWIREFFRRFLPVEQYLPGRWARYYWWGQTDLLMSAYSQKMSNEGIVKFQLRLPADGSCEIVPETAEFVRGGMENRWIR